MTYEISAGMTAMGVARYAPLMTSGGRHALTVAGGAYSLVSGGFGPVAFAHGEAAYEFRGTYVTFLAGYGANLTLNDSERQTTYCGIGLFGPPPTCEVGFDRGDLLGHIRFGVGMTF
jgi:hypothetical protein